MFRCRACRTAFLHPVPEAAWLEEFYREFHLPAEAGGTYDEAEGRVAADFPAKVALIRSKVGSGRARVLDVGCGKGLFVRACLDVGFDASGVDISAVAIEAARNELAVPAVCGAIEDLAPRLGRFDVVTLWATLEHLRDPLATLSAIHDVLAPGGWLFLDTGTGDDLLERLLPGLTQWYDPPQHLFVFSSTGIKVLLGKAGFSIVSIDPCFERSRLRRVVRLTRGLGTATALRILAAVSGLTPGRFPFTRFPLGNLMSVVCRKERREGP